MRGLGVRALTLGAFLFVAWEVEPAGTQAQDAQSAAIKPDCQELLQKYLSTPAPGYFYYVEDPNSTKYRCHYTKSRPGYFDEYPGPEALAFSRCQEAAEKAGIKAPCLPIARGTSIVARSYDEARRVVESTVPGGLMAMNSMRCGQQPGNRFYWMERAFCDLPIHGPDKARGIVIWNHGLSGTRVAYAAPAALALRLLQLRGWDVIKNNRHNLAEANVQESLSRSVERTLEMLTVHRSLGYKKIVLAGQSFGGLITLEAAETSGDIFAAVAMAPGVTTATGRLDTAMTDRILKRAKTERLAVVFPKDDQLFGNLVRGESAEKILAARNAPYLLLDETSGLTGHGGGTGGNFALRYGLCLAEFLSAPSLPPGRFVCPAVDPWAVAGELMPKRPKHVKVITDPATLPEPIRGLMGLWYGLLGETIVSFALVESGGPDLRAVYSWVAGTRGGVTADALVEGERVKVTLPNKAVVTVTPKGATEAEITFTAADAGLRESNFAFTGGRGSGVLQARLVKVREHD